MVGMHYILEIFTVKIRADCMLHGSQKHSAHNILYKLLISYKIWMKKIKKNYILRGPVVQKLVSSTLHGLT